MTDKDKLDALLLIAIAYFIVSPIISLLLIAIVWAFS